MKRLIILVLLFSCEPLIRQAVGQNAPPEALPPKNPLLPRAPEFSSWTIVEKVGKPAPTPSPADAISASGATPKEISCTVTKAGTTYREVSKNPGRGETTKWMLDGLQIQQDPGTSRWIRIPRTKFSLEFSDYTRSDFEIFEWISRDNYKGIQKYEGRLCYVFEVASEKKRLTPRERYYQSLGDRESGETSAGEPNHTLIAYLDVNTQLPVALKKGDILTTYTFNPPPTAPLSPPADALESLTKWKNAIEARNRPPPRP